MHGLSSGKQEGENRVVKERENGVRMDPTDDVEGKREGNKRGQRAA